jgi:hypothetical protein
LGTTLAAVFTEHQTHADTADNEPKSLEGQLAEALAKDGSSTRVASRGTLPDGSEVRGLPETIEFVRHLLVFARNEIDDEEARAILRSLFSWISLRRRRDGDDPK